MPLDYKTTNDLMNDQDFDGRTRVACLKYASYMSGEPSDTPAHNTRIHWAQRALTNPDVVAAEIKPVLVMDDRIQSAGAAVTDTDLQSALESSVNKMF